MSMSFSRILHTHKKKEKIMPNNNLITEIQGSIEGFTKTEKKIAEYVLKNTDKVLFMSITELAENCKVADASVHRFCRTMKVKGYQEFKMKLSLSSNTEEQAVNEGLANLSDEGIEGKWNRQLEQHLNVLKETRLLIKKEDIEKTVAMMEQAKNIYFFGIGDSLITAKEARNRFQRITNKVTCVEDPHMQAMTASLMGPEDMIFFISYSGATKDNIYVASIAQSLGVKMIGITRFAKSPLTSYTDIVLLCGSNEGPMDGGSFGAKISQLYIIDILFQEYYRRNKSLSLENNHKTSKAVVDKLY